MPFKLGPLEIGLILLIVLMVFGVGKLPQVGASLGKAIRSFKQGASGEDEEETKGPKKVRKAKARKIVAKRGGEIKAGVGAEARAEEKARETL
jgi:sec-independent protein translocase protein TatA